MNNQYQKLTGSEIIQKLAQILKEKKQLLPKYGPKDCGSCDGNKEKGINTLCDFHLEYSYERILQKIAREKRERNNGRMILGVIALFFLSVILFVLSTLWKYPASELKNFTSVFHLFGQAIVYFPGVIGLLGRNEKDAQRGLGEYEKDKAKGTITNHD